MNDLAITAPAGIRHIVSAADFNADDLEIIFGRARVHKGVRRRNSADTLAGMIMAPAFQKPSTRTWASGIAAWLRCGGKIIPIPEADVFSSFAKNESIEDTITVLSDDCDLIFMRHGEEGAAARAAAVARVPLVNAGDGTNEHPTQALLDLFTIWEAIANGRLPQRPLRIAFFGDNAKSRTVRSLCLLLARHAATLGITIESMTFDGPAYCAEPPADVFASLPRIGTFMGFGTPSGYLPKTDVLYLTRAQRENYTPEERAALAETIPFIFTREHAELMPEHALIMHPLPRNFELATSVDADRRAYYFEQAANGWPVRAALFEHLLGVL